MKIFDLNDSVKLFYIHDHRFKTESLSLHYLLPTVPNQNAAVYLLPSILADGCRKYTDEYSIAGVLNRLYGADIFHRVTRMGNHTEIVFSMECLHEQYISKHIPIFEKTASILFDLVYDPLRVDECFSDVYFQREASLLSKEAVDFRHRREEYSRFLARKSILKGDFVYRNPIYGTNREIAKLQLQDLNNAYERLMTSTLYLVYIGKRSVEEILKSLPLHRLSSHKKMQDFYRAPAVVSSNSFSFISENAPIDQSHVTLGYYIDAEYLQEQRAVFTVFMQVLSDSPISKLFCLREETSICYSVAAYRELLSGIIYLTASVDPGREREVTALMKKCMMEMKSGNISENELDVAKKEAVSRIKAMKDNRELFEEWLAHAVFMQKALSMDTLLDCIEQVKIKDIIEFVSHIQYSAHAVVRGTGGN